MSRWFFVGSCGAICALLLSVGSGAGASGGSAPARSILKRAESGVIRVEASGCGRLLSGTGFLLDDHHLATAEHVVAGADRILLRRGRRVVAVGTVAGADSAHDVALIQTDRPIRGHVFSLSARGPRSREGVAALGFPLGRPLTVARGTVHGSARMVGAGGRAGQALIQTDASVHEGHSGGPLLSLTDGTVLGMVDLSSADRARPLSFAVSARAAAPLLARWRRDPEAVAQEPCPSGPSAVGYPASRLPGAGSLPPAHM
jgi:S1-C subfamily serine protease